MEHGLHDVEHLMDDYPESLHGRGILHVMLDLGQISHRLDELSRILVHPDSLAETSGPSPITQYPSLSAGHSLPGNNT